ncbi:glycine betaine/proline transport system permease protein [Paenochrobactrum gallinarii]|uniref:Glycine betaine/proline transport system permease protein n=1 Tax=Paenochrobactrum gallinarii TaxID=643673 RepID=A0A841M0X9_9HYPH|nr:proline/glycine betaine ABC transporter permease [Paenochrobactrum gallinarii]MBB6262407.1 glycine betaine/proline transport system permease protein [Paenochrobactrum gallinarii]
MFFDFGKPIARSTNEFVEYLVINYGDAFEAITNSILKPLLFIEGVLRSSPPVIILAVVLCASLLSTRNIWLSILLTFLTWLIGCFGLWEPAMQTLAIMLVSLLISIILGLPLGIICANSSRFRAVLSPILDLMQTIPSFVYLIPAAMLFGLGKVPAVLATVIYAAPPLIRLTDLGIRHVNAEVVEAARSFGATKIQILRGVQIPLALPSIMAGINQTMMMALAMVVIASMIGARGVGETVLLGLQRNDAGRGLLGGLAIVIMAIVLDRITQGFGRRLQARRPHKGG